MVFLAFFFMSCKTNPFKDFWHRQKEYHPYVVLTYHDDAVSVTVLLEELNLKSEFSFPPEPYTENSFSVIQVGENFPFEKFKEITLFIKNYYPQLRYVDLITKNDRVPEKSLYLLFIGANTEIAIKKNLKAWNDKDFEQFRNSKTKEEMISFIQNKNQKN